MLKIGAALAIPETEFQWSFVRAGGPGGQNVNKVATKAQLRWPLRASAHVPDAVKSRLLTLYGHRVTATGDLLVTSQRFRDRERNRKDCVRKLTEMLQQALQTPRPRKASRPTRASREERLRSKKRHGQLKSARRAPDGDE